MQEVSSFTNGAEQPNLPVVAPVQSGGSQQFPSKCFRL